jgi:hypothetical protein
MEKYSYLIAKTAEQVEEAIHREDRKEVIQRTEELIQYLQAVEMEDEFSSELQDLLNYLQMNNEITGKKDVVDSTLGSLQSIKYGFAVNLFSLDSPSTVDTVATNNIDVTYDELKESSMLASSIDKYTDNNKYPHGYIDEYVNEYLGLNLPIDEIPDDLQQVLAFAIAENRTAVLTQVENMMEIGKQTNTATQNIQEVTEGLSDMNDRMEESLDEIGGVGGEAKELREFKDRIQSSLDENGKN